MKGELAGVARTMILAVAVMGCDRSAKTGADPTAISKDSAAASAGSAGAMSPPLPPSTQPSFGATPALPSEPFPCGSLTCQAFATPRAAFTHVIDADRPLVLALGESHAQKGSEAIKSTTARFTEDFLPALQGKASSLVLELWVADGKCGKKKEKEVAEKQKEVTQNQAETNQNEFVKLGEKAKSLDVIPFILRPSCEEYDTINNAGDNAVLEMLSMITRNMRDKATALYKETDKSQHGKIVVTYGGAMHNDRAPKQGRESWSFAADLDRLSSGRYVELDLVVPEFIKPTESWKSLPWYGSYDADRFRDATVLITMGPRSYALIFPRTKS